MNTLYHILGGAEEPKEEARRLRKMRRVRGLGSSGSSGSSASALALALCLGLTLACASGRRLQEAREANTITGTELETLEEAQEGALEPIICPHCGSKGPHDYLYSTSTAMGISTWVDERGGWHMIDPNYTTNYFRCRKCEREFTR